jgi:hypothetical protein
LAHIDATTAAESIDSFFKQFKGLKGLEISFVSGSKENALKSYESFKRVFGPIEITNNVMYNIKSVDFDLTGEREDNVGLDLRTGEVFDMKTTQVPERAIIKPEEFREDVERANCPGPLKIRKI